ncbi:MAG TPA: nitroreductase family protein [Rhizomicrobium sp.]|nr:nitroreductase family protein [Rhizomicrobium sp.]
MDVLEVIRRRRAVRDYKSDPVPSALVRQLISAACWAPSAMNEQPWHYTVVTDPELMNEISRQAKNAMLKNLGTVPRPDHFQDLLNDPHYNIFYNAPMLVVISAPAARPWCVEDCAMAAENMMLAAFEHGLGSCWIGFAQTWLNSAEGLRALGLPRTQRVVAPIILGFPKSEPPSVARKSAAMNWIGDGVNAVERVEEQSNPGVYGVLVHP